MSRCMTAEDMENDSYNDRTMNLIRKLKSFKQNFVDEGEEKLYDYVYDALVSDVCYFDEKKIDSLEEFVDIYPGINEIMKETLSIIKKTLECSEQDTDVTETDCSNSDSSEEDVNLIEEAWKMNEDSSDSEEYESDDSD